MFESLRHYLRQPWLLRGIALLATALWLTVPLGAQDGFHTQRIELQPGWNAVFVEVMPEPARIEEVFSGLPIVSVWGHFPAFGEPDFVTDPDEEALRSAGWRGYFPARRPESVLTNLFALEINRAYLVKLGGVSPVTLEIRGRPLDAPFPWVPSSFNLVGFHVDPLAPPSFGSFFAASAAHAGQPIYRLVEGRWQRVENPFSSIIEPGEAYWVYSQGPSDYQGPLEVTPPAYEGMDFSTAADTLRLTVRNRSLADTRIRLRALPSPVPVPLAVGEFDDDSGLVLFSDLPAVYSVEARSGQEAFIELGLRRADLGADRAEQLLEITDGLGSRRLVMVGASRVQPRAAARGRGKVAANHPSAGLWVGDVTINRVNEAQRGAPGNCPEAATETGSTFGFRMLIYVDGAGDARLLKEVIQMWEDGTTMPDPNDPELQVVDQPGRYVLVSDDALISLYSGATQRNGAQVGVRLSTAAYDFSGHELAMEGDMLPFGHLGVTLRLEPNDPTHPYEHRYHPDHDNLDAEFANFELESYDITRVMSVRFSEEHPAGRPPPGWGSEVFGGTYHEEITGLHKNKLCVEGIAFFERVSTAELNP